MKKILSLVLAGVLLFGCIALTSCAQDVQIGVQRGTTAQYYVDGDEDWAFPGLAGYAAKGYDNAGLAATAMKNGAVKYVMVDKAPAEVLVDTIDGIKLINVELTEEEYAIGVDKAQADLLASINAVLAEMKTDGTMDAIMEKYFNGEEVTPIESAVQDSAKADQQLVVATNAEFSPFEYFVGDKYAGIDIEIVKHIADELGMELVIKHMDFDAVVTAVGVNGIDIAVAALTVNEKRAESVNFTDSYYQAAQMLIVPADDTTFDACTTAEAVVAKLEELNK